MDRSQARGASPVAPILMIAGAALVLIGCVLPWFTVSANLARFGAASRSFTGNGMDTSDGTIFLVTAIGIAVLGVVALIAKTRSSRLAVSVIAALGALFVGAVAIYNAVTPRSQAIDELTKEIGGGGIAGLAVRRFVEGLFDRGVISIGVDVGLWIVVVGAVVALIGSIMAATSAGSFEATPTNAGAPAFPYAVARWSSDVPASAPDSGAMTATPAGAPAAPMAPSSSQPTSPGSADPPMTTREPQGGPVVEDADRAPDE